MTDADALLRRSAADIAREVEVDRVMKSFKLNPYDVLDITYTATEADIKRLYRKKSLLIHPDKFKHEQAEEAFDHLKKAEGLLSEKSKRAEIDTIIHHARGLVLKAVLGDGNAANVQDSDPRLESLNPPFETQIRNKAKEVLVEEELAKRRKVQVQFANEGAEKKKQEEEVANRKRKVEEKEKWEERREERINSWRDYSKKSTKKKKKNEHVLG